MRLQKTKALPALPRDSKSFYAEASLHTGGVFLELSAIYGFLLGSRELGRQFGRLAQRESTRFTREGSLVQSQYCPPFYLTTARAGGNSKALAASDRYSGEYFA